jgi:hypothetical protein
VCACFPTCRHGIGDSDSAALIRSQACRRTCVAPCRASRRPTQGATPAPRIGSATPTTSDSQTQVRHARLCPSHPHTEHCLYAGRWSRRVGPGAWVAEVAAGACRHPPRPRQGPGVLDHGLRAAEAPGGLLLPGMCACGAPLRVRVPNYRTLQPYRTSNYTPGLARPLLCVSMLTFAAHPRF